MPSPGDLEAERDAGRRGWLSMGWDSAVGLLPASDSAERSETNSPPRLSPAEAQADASDKAATPRPPRGKEQPAGDDGS